MSPVRIGLEIGARTVRAVWSTAGWGRAGAWQVRDVTRTDASDPAALAGDLAKLLRPLRSRRSTASLCAAAPASTLRVLTLRAADAAHVPQAVAAELPSLLPFEVDRARHAFRIRRQQRVEDALECTVIVAACEAASLQQMLDALWRAGWPTYRAMPAALALARSAKALGVTGADPVILMDLGERQTTMVLVENGEPIYARDVTLGHEHVTDALMGQVSVEGSTLSLTREEAETLKRDAGLPPAQAGTTVGPRRIPIATYLAMVQPILEQLVSEIRRTMTFGARATQATAPVRVMVSGGGVHIPHLDEWLAKQLGVPVARLDCSPLLGPSGAAGAVACGLALGDEQGLRIDLAPRAWRQRWLLTRTAALLWRTLTLATALIWMGAGWWQSQGQQTARTLRALTAQWASVQPMADLARTVEERAHLIDRLTAASGIGADWLQRLAADFPEPVRLTRLAADGPRHTQLDGEAQELDQTPEAYVSELSLWLDRAGLCRDVQVGSTTRVDGDTPLMQFSLACRRGS